MSNLIEREALLNEIDDAFLKSPIEETTAWMLGRRIVRKFPAVEPKQGEWLFDEDGYFFCSECEKYPPYQIATTDYCPNCGARMKGKDDAD